MLTPYQILLDMSEEEKHYNLLHSRTRMKIECAFGLFKCKFRIFKSVLLNKDSKKMGKIISSCMILHNWFIDLDGEPDFNEYSDFIEEEDRDLRNDDTQILEREDLLLLRDSVKSYLFNNY